MQSGKHTDFLSFVFFMQSFLYESFAWQLGFPWKWGVVTVQSFLVFSKYLSGPGGQVQALDKNTYPPLSNHRGMEPSCVWGGLLLLQSPLPKVRERDYCCSKASKIRKNLFFFKTVESDLTPVTFSFITLGCRKCHVLHSHWSKDLCRDTLRRVSHAAVLTWSIKVLSVHVLQVQAGQKTPFQAFAWTKAAEAQPADKTVVGHAVGLHDGGFDSNYNNGKSEGLSMFSVGDVLACLPPSAWFLL